MKKLIITLLVLVISFSAFAVGESAKLELNTIIQQKNTLKFVMAKDNADITEAVNLSATGVSVKVCLSTNKVSQENLPTVKLSANPLVHESKNGAFVSYIINDTTTVSASAIDGVVANLFDKKVEGTPKTLTDYYSEVITIKLGDTSTALQGTYTGSLVVTVTAN